MSNNTNYGTGSLSNTSGPNNTAFGAYALYNNLDPSCNTAVGSNSQFFNTIGAHNTAVGAGSLCNNTTGNLNTAVGSSALEGETPNQSVGDENVAVGAQALFNNSGNNNTAIGTYACLSNTTGTDNTSLGYGAGINLISGSNNTFLGSSTDISNFVTNYNQSTALGYGAMIDASNQIMMGTASESVVIPGQAFLTEQFPPSKAYTSESIVPKAYIDQLAVGIRFIGACVCATTGPITLANTQTIDGVSVVAGNQVLVKNQGGTATDITNGIYVVVSGGPWTRSTDYDVGYTPAKGAAVSVSGGTINGGKNFIQIQPPSGNGIVGTDALQFITFNTTTNINVTNTNASETFYPVFVSNTGSNVPFYADTTTPQFTYNPYTGTMIIPQVNVETGGYGKLKITATGSGVYLSNPLFGIGTMQPFNFCDNDNNPKTTIASTLLTTPQIRTTNINVALGLNAGVYSQGQYAVAIGNQAGETDQAANSIVINATTTALNNTTANSCVIKPIRNINTSLNPLCYNATSGELAYNTNISMSSSLDVTGNANISGFVSTPSYPGAYIIGIVNGNVLQLPIFASSPSVIGFYNTYYNNTSGIITLGNVTANPNVTSSVTNSGTVTLFSPTAGLANDTGAYYLLNPGYKLILYQHYSYNTQSYELNGKTASVENLSPRPVNFQVNVSGLSSFKLYNYVNGSWVNIPAATSATFG